MLDEDLFEKLSDPVTLKLAGLKECADNVCPDCNIQMDVGMTDYRCNECGFTRAHQVLSTQLTTKDTNRRPTGGNSIRVSTGVNKGKIRSGTTDYSRVRKKNIMDQLRIRQETYTGTVIPKDVLMEAAEKYNQIQHLIVDDDEKSVRRGNIKNEILAALIYFEGIRAKAVRKRRDVAEFMGLETDGFSRGEGVVRDWVQMGFIDLPVNEEPTEGFVDRYIEALGLENPLYNQFVCELVQASETCKIGMKSQIASKVVGAIWVLITQRKLEITSQQLEKASDNTKKNTFMRFYKEVFKNIEMLRGVFEKYDVSCQQVK